MFVMLMWRLMIESTNACFHILPSSELYAPTVKLALVAEYNAPVTTICIWFMT